MRVVFFFYSNYNRTVVTVMVIVQAAEFHRGTRVQSRARISITPARKSGKNVLPLYPFMLKTCEYLTRSTNYRTLSNFAIPAKTKGEVFNFITDPFISFFRLHVCCNLSLTSAVWEVSRILQYSPASDSKVARVPAANAEFKRPLYEAKEKSCDRKATLDTLLIVEMHDHFCKLFFLRAYGALSRDTINFDTDLGKIHGAALRMWMHTLEVRNVLDVSDSAHHLGLFLGRDKRKQ